MTRNINETIKMSNLLEQKMIIKNYNIKIEMKLLSKNDN